MLAVEVGVFLGCEWSTERLPDLIRNIEERAEIGPYKEQQQGGGGNT